MTALEVTGLGWCSNSPSNPYPAEAWFARARWTRGDCPCCGGQAGPAAVAVAEGVLLCGWCARPDHAPGDAGRVRLLTAIAVAPEHCTGP